MSPNREDLIYAIESSWHVLDEATPVVEPMNVPGLHGHVSALSGPLINGVGVTRLEKETADETIRLVIDRFANECKAFAWSVGPGAAPADLAKRLEAAGLELFTRTAGMALTDLDQDLPANPSIRIEQAEAAKARQAVQFMAESFGLGASPEVMGVFVDSIAAVQDRYDSRTYLAFSDDSAAPIAWAWMTRTHDPRIAWLAGSATVPSHRGRGVYKSMVSRRVADARAGGAKAAVIQAVRETSAPICRRLGFVELCGLDLYAWTPPER